MDDPLRFRANPANMVSKVRPPHTTTGSYSLSNERESTSATLVMPCVPSLASQTLPLTCSHEEMRLARRTIRNITITVYMYIEYTCT